ncbi:helix-turn-helix domain-containing protein [Cellulomonas massiliensis]|uniref:helix-turn-helix domain-containing protein n=1 Tax=Cellulomonas massiliensis TaxID=1465811 RepID=UPI0002D68A91|nr:helix-turn-helix domain-containing protein [Cellulomonas massiliensis]
MATDYNVTLELDTRDGVDEQLLDALPGYAPATGRSPFGNVELILTVPARDLATAVQTATAVLAASPAAVDVLAVAATTTAEFDRRVGTAPMPALVSVTEAAAIAGVSRQAILQRLESGSLAGEKIGTTWVVQRDAVRAPRATPRTTAR